MPNYGNKRYWDKRYKTQKGTVFEWLENYAELKEVINKHCEKDGVILNLGCGNSIIQEDMYDDGYTNIFNIDISPLCIEQMEARKQHRTQLVYEVMDCTELKYKDEMFDFVIDKSTIDALLCGEDSYLNVAKMFSEVQRVLKPGGIYLIVSYGEPYNRTFHFERNHIDFTFTHFPLPPKDAEDGSGSKQNPHYVYILTKGPLADQKYLDNYEEVILELIQEEAEARQKYGYKTGQDSGDEEEEIIQADKKQKEKVERQEEVEDKEMREGNQENNDQNILSYKNSDVEKEELIKNQVLIERDVKQSNQNEECKQNKNNQNEDKLSELKIE